MSENVEFADLCAQSGVIFVGPPASAIRYDSIYLPTYHLDGQVCLKSGVVNHFIDKKKVDNTKINKKRVNNTNFKTNLTVQVVLHDNISQINEQNIVSVAR